MKYPNYTSPKAYLSPMTVDAKVSLDNADAMALLAATSSIYKGVALELVGKDGDYTIKVTGNNQQVTGAVSYIMTKAYE